VRKHLAPEDLGDLLERPLVAVLATFRADGRVLLSPVWHRWRDGGFDVVTGADDVKVRHLRRAARAIASRYLGEQDGAAYADSSGDDTLIRLEPGVLRAWDFIDDLG
jgi:pyridoxamine 5'-phosphate oxidase-like protein